MIEHHAAVAKLAQDLVRLDSRSALPNAPIADRAAAEFRGWDIENLAYTDPAGIEKHVLVVARGWNGLAFSGHMDTVPDTGWTAPPWSGLIEHDTLHGLGSADMKGPVAAAIVAMRSLPPRLPVALFLTTDEETTKQGARHIVQHSALAKQFHPRAILVVEPTRMVPVRGHRSSIAITAVAHGVQAHSSTGQGRNANWALLPFLTEMHTLHNRLRTDPAWQDPAYDPSFCDLNLTIDNHGAAVNVTVPRATARLKFRYSAGVDTAPVLDFIRAAAARTGITLTLTPEGRPPELPATHDLVTRAEHITGRPAGTVPFGTDAAELQAIAPCLIMGPGDIAHAHTPTEHVSLTALAEAVPVFMQMAIKTAV